MYRLTTEYLFQEITLWRKGDKAIKSHSSPHVPNHLVSGEGGPKGTEPPRASRDNSAFEDFQREDEGEGEGDGRGDRMGEDDEGEETGSGKKDSPLEEDKPGQEETIPALPEEHSDEPLPPQDNALSALPP